MGLLNKSWIKALGMAVVVAAAVLIVPDLAAERSEASSDKDVETPLDEELTERLETRLKQPRVTEAASRSMGEAIATASAASAARTDETTFERARSAFHEERYEEAERLLVALIDYHDQLAREGEGGDGDHSEARRQADRARLLYAHVLSKTDRHAERARVLTGVSEDNPVDDFVHWFRGRALMRAGEPAEAALAFEEAWKEDTTLVKPRARVEQAHALSAAEQWKQALEVLDEVIDRFPDYPRRHRHLYNRARALEELGRYEEAAEAYQTAWFEFPHKPEGADARDAMRRLARDGHRVEPIDRDELFDRYRQLRINKHWALAEDLFLELLDEHRTDEGTSEFEHEIMMQLGLNDYVPQKHRDALEWFETLRSHYEAGETDGIDGDTMYKYLSLTYSEMGRVDEARRAVEQRTSDKHERTQKRFMAEFYEDHGQYEKARALYDDIYSSWRKRGWHYTWLLYKTGEFERAYDNLRRLAERSGGEQRARYLYWAGRTLERGGNFEEAVEVFAKVARGYDLSYYGIQANNRLVDIEQRQTMDDTLLSHAKNVLDSGNDAITALDRAAERADDGASSLSTMRRDPRTIPRTADLEASPSRSGSAPDNRCDEQLDSTDPRCASPSERAVPESRKVVRNALAPIRPYSRLLSSDVFAPSVEGTFGEASGAEAMDAVDQRLAENEPSGRAANPPRRAALEESKTGTRRADYYTDARIYWEGRTDSPIAFVKAERGEVIGPLPDHPRAYDEKAYRDGLERAVEEVGHLFPQLERARWLRDAGYPKYARRAMRDAALEYGGLVKKGRPYGEPHELSQRRWEHLIDNRHQESGLWGMDSDEKRYPVPSSSKEKQALLERHRQIYQRRNELEQLMLDAMKDVGDYHLVRRATMGDGPWYRQEPDGPMRDKWMQAYPRAFPRQVLEQSREHGINPYLLWALMTVESSYNPDSISPADAIGLLQVIPRTGIKTAQMLGDEDFGPFDLVNEDVAIEHGAFYFRNLIEKFRGQELLAIAGYNGGPHRVGAWLDKRGTNMPMDEFVEEIPFDEARGYVKKVVRFLNLYLRIYEGVDNLYVGQNMRVDYLPQPNF